MNEDSHVGSGHFVWIGLKVGLNVDDKRGTDRREQTSLVNEKSTIRMVRKKERKNSTHKDEAGVEVLVVLPDILAVKFVGFPAVGGEEVSARIVGRQWFKEVFEDGMEATSGVCQLHGVGCCQAAGGAHHFRSTWTAVGPSVCETLFPPLDFGLDSSLVCDGAEFAPWERGGVCAMDPSTDTTSNSKRAQRKNSGSAGFAVHRSVVPRFLWLTIIFLIIPSFVMHQSQLLMGCRQRHEVCTTRDSADAFPPLISVAGGLYTRYDSPPIHRPSPNAHNLLVGARKQASNRVVGTTDQVAGCFTLLANSRV